MGLAALGAGGRRFESFCPDLKIKELQVLVTPFSFHNGKFAHNLPTGFQKFYIFARFIVNRDQGVPWS